MALNIALIALIFLTRERWDAWVVEQEFPPLYHGAVVDSLRPSAHGRLVAISGFGETQLLDIRTGKETASLWASTWCAVSADGDYVLAAIAEGPEQTAVVLDCESGVQYRLEVRAVGISALAVSPDGTRCVVATTDGHAAVWHMGTGRKLCSLGTSTAVVICAEWSPDGSAIATGTDDAMVCLWDAGTGRLTAEMDEHNLLRVESVTFSADGRRLVSCDSFDCRVWDTGEGTIAIAAETNAFAMSPGSRLLATARLDGGIQLWDLATTKATAVLRTDANYPDVIRFSPDGGRLAALFRDGEMQVWNVADAGLLWRRFSSSPPQNDVGYLAFTPGGWHILTCGIYESPDVWDAETGCRLVTLPGSSPCCVLDDGRICAADGVGGIRVYGRFRPEQWWGIFCLWHFWTIAALGAALAWSAWRDIRRMSHPAREAG
jgi:WD40 repeat protein